MSEPSLNTCSYIYLQKAIYWVKTNLNKYHLYRIANKILRQEKPNKNHLFHCLQKNQIYWKINIKYIYQKIKKYTWTSKSKKS